VADSEKLVENHRPVASLERLGQLGMDPAKYGSCSPKGNGNIGCSHFPSCPFDRKQFGQFKGTRPHNIGYYVRPMSGPAKTDWMSCYQFCAGLYHRMRAGLAAAAEGQKGEVIRIIGKEGDEIPMKIVKSFDPNCNKSLNTRLKVENVKVKIPVFRDPLEADPALAYEMELDKKFPMDMESLMLGGVADEAEAARLMASVVGPDIPLPDEVETAVAAKVKKNG
jgi:hypothetical protein